MMDAWHPRTLTDAEFVRHMHRENARLEAMDREIERKEAAERSAPDNLRALTALEAPRDLAALGMAQPYMSWALGVVTTRLWLLEILSLLDEFQRWRIATWAAELVRDERRKRRFGSAAVTRADLEEARVGLGYANEQWATISERASWVLRDLDPARLHEE